MANKLVSIRQRALHDEGTLLIGRTLQSWMPRGFIFINPTLCWSIVLQQSAAFCAPCVNIPSCVYLAVCDAVNYRNVIATTNSKHQVLTVL